MLALQGKTAREILAGLLEAGRLPEPLRNELSIATRHASAREPGRRPPRAVEVRIGRTGYTGEPLCFELFVAAEDAPALWDALVEAGAEPVGLGARDTLRLEAGLPLYGHELGLDPEGGEIPVMSCPLASFAVSFSPRKGDYVGRAALARQHRAYGRILVRDWSLVDDLPQHDAPGRHHRPRHRPRGRRGLPRRRARRLGDERHRRPLLGRRGRGPLLAADRGAPPALDRPRLRRQPRRSRTTRSRSTCAASASPGSSSRTTCAATRRPARGPSSGTTTPQLAELAGGEAGERALRLIDGAIDNHEWRQRRCIDLIPSEMTASPLVRLLSITDPAFRYAEHKKTEAFYDLEVFYYQGTGFIHEVERLLVQELRAYLGCAEVETRVISGQMANAAVFSALVDYLNRGDRKAEPRRIAKVINNHIGKGGHLSAQPMGALKRLRRPRPAHRAAGGGRHPGAGGQPVPAPTSRPCSTSSSREQPELIILGKSMVLHPEPVYEVRTFLDAIGSRAVLMYDMAHVLGLVGPHFQEPFIEGADLVTGSTHKTFFGTQRGIIGGRWREPEEKWELWEAIERRAFPGSVSNHHLGTLLGLLMAAYEMNHFKDAYQQAVIANAKAFARALKDAGLRRRRRPRRSTSPRRTRSSSTSATAWAPDVAGRLEANNIICNYQATPDEEGFTAAGGLRLGVVRDDPLRHGPG